MYLHYVLPEIESGTYQTLDSESLPIGLQVITMTTGATWG